MNKGTERASDALRVRRKSTTDKILDYIKMNGPCTREDIVMAFSGHWQSVSAHEVGFRLGVLERAGVIEIATGTWTRRAYVVA